ncbi:TetR/AcrR family transcriptional regulator [Rugosimonospora africana]|uniref:TetR family transcriptional regulator n=1 Tax=Rugosimonospora africana TaxID=556532 RepID=A0A8J3VR11_9ACTN|nr:TetR/AcrR family transcriptional regulator [Rugosimonospora africana]GIH15612.1 TetR family transcriptional regulator [Rugosimonospora africana]
MTSSYHSPRRADAAAATRTAILASARALFLERGYADVTVSDIAKAARVAVQTVYASAGGKAAILSALLQPARESPIIAETLAAIAVTDDPRRIIDLTADGTRRGHEQHWETLYGLFRHAPAEPAARKVYDASVAAYLGALSTVLDRLVHLNGLAPGLDHAQALDLMWFYLGRPAWFTLIGDRGWSFDQAQAWLAGSARRALLADPDSGPAD